MPALQAKQILNCVPTEKDEAHLKSCLEWVNKERFSGNLEINARWEYPSAIDYADPAEAIKALPHNEQELIGDAVKAYSERNWAKARMLLEPFVGYELKLVTNLYTSAMRHLKEPVWFNKSQSLWASESDRAAAAVASIEVKGNEELILVSPALSSIGFNAPRYVLCYVLFHEGLHKILNTTPSNPHPRLFRTLESAAYRRDCAVEWLRRNRFSTIEDL